MKKIIILLSIIFSLNTFAQVNRWQQHVDYTIDINLDVKNHLFKGKQKLIYTNNSPDTLKTIYYHLYFNAFQPGSMMDERSRAIEDPDPRVKNRISKLKDNQQGKIYPTSLTQNGKSIKFKVVGTILEVTLAHPILPKSTTTFNMIFKGQVPIQIRRSGRNNKEGIDYSMSQWYPKISEYDYDGWHANPYIAREFYGVWGNYKVNITLNSSYIIGATGVLQNRNDIGYGYQDLGVVVKKHKKNKLLTWKFKAENVHDFVWAADQNYTHKTIQVPNGPKMHFIYQKDPITTKSWPQLINISSQMVTFMNTHFGKYPYSDFSVIQGGDGGMEYPMATLIAGKQSYKRLLSVTIHEMLHSWYQGVLATNETLYPWMDEGFTTYASNITKAYLTNNNKDPQTNSYKGYYYLVKRKKQEPLTTHADHYTTNLAYSIASYSMGAMVPAMLEYIIGKQVFEQAFRTYFNTWQFKHPNPTDFRRIIEKESGFELKWFFNDWIGTTHQVDYAIDSVYAINNTTQIILANKGTMPMPTEVFVTLKDGNSKIYYLPLSIMQNHKKIFGGIESKLVGDWAWTNPVKTININTPINKIKSIELNKNKRVPDVNQSNDNWQNN